MGSYLLYSGQPDKRIFVRSDSLANLARGRAWALDLELVQTGMCPDAYPAAVKGFQ
jgi:hypothetical protein